MAQSGRSYSAARFAVAIDGIPAGFAVSVSGGERFAEVLERPGTGGLVDKHLGPVQFEPIVLEIGAAPGPLLDWVRDALGGAANAHDGVISLLDYTNRERQRLEWTTGRPRRDRLPDRRRRRPEQRPASTSRSTPTRRDSPPDRTARSARSCRSARSRSATATSVWRSPGSRPACRKTRTVSAITFRLHIAPEDVGAVRPGAGNPVRVVDDVTFTVPTPDAQTFRAWFDDLANGTGTERTAQLAFLAPSLKDDLLRIDLGGVGVCRVADVRQVSGSQAIASSEVTMYCESAALAPTPQTTAPQPDAATASPAIATADLDRLAGRLAGVIAGRTPTTASSPQSIADRLLATTTTAPTAPADATELGRSLGRAWASDIAGLGELDDVAALADGGDWTGLALDPDGSLVAFLTERGVLDPTASTPGELDRDDLVAGLVAGAAEVHAAVTPLLTSAHARRATRAAGHVTLRRRHPRIAEE